MQAPRPNADWAKTLAAQLIASGGAAPDELDVQQRLELAWALKDYAVTAWSSAPNEVTIAANAIGALSAPVSKAPRNRDELAAITAWVNGIAELIRGGMTNALSCLDRATSLFESLGEEGHAAHAQVPKIMALAMLGRHDEAAQVGEDTMRRLSACGDTRSAAKVNINLGQLYCQRGRYHDAIAHLRDAKKTFAEFNEAQYESACELGLADAYLGIGELDEARATYDRVLKLSSRFQLDRDAALAIESLALLDLAQGKYSDALVRLDAARQRYEALEMPQYAAMAEHQLGVAYFELHLLPEALSLLEEACTKYELLEMPVESAWAKLHAAMALASLRRSPEEIERAFADAARLFEAEALVVGQATVFLAQAEFALSNQDAEHALDLATRAGSLFAQVEHPLGANQARAVCANAQLMLGHIDEARTSFTSVLDQAIKLQLIAVHAHCLVGLGRTTAATGDLELARNYYESAIEILDTQRSTLPSEDMRAAFLADHLRPFREVLRLNLLEPDETNVALAFAQLERYRARTLAEGQSEQSYAFRNDRAHADADTLKQRAHLDWMYRRIRQLQEEGEDVERLTHESQRVEKQLLERARREHCASGQRRAPSRVPKHDGNKVRSIRDQKRVTRQ
jgi:tetratricopeptide (TPR) repeat protein